MKRSGERRKDECIWVTCNTEKVRSDREGAAPAAPGKALPRTHGKDRVSIRNPHRAGSAMGCAAKRDEGMTMWQGRPRPCARPRRPCHTAARLEAAPPEWEERVLRLSEVRHLAARPRGSSLSTNWTSVLFQNPCKQPRCAPRSDDEHR